MSDTSVVPHDTDVIWGTVMAIRDKGIITCHHYSTHVARLCHSYDTFVARPYESTQYHAVGMDTARKSQQFEIRSGANTHNPSPLS